MLFTDMTITITKSMLSRSIRVIILFVSFCACADAASLGFASNNNGSAESSSGHFRNNAYLMGASGELTGSNFRVYSGFAPALTDAPVLTSLLAIDNSMVFSDESPTSSQMLDTTYVTFKVTVEITGAETIGNVSYKFSNSGVSALPAAVLRTDVSTDTVITPGKKVVYKISFPTSSGAVLSVTDNNYIQMFAKNSAGADAAPAIFRIKVQSNSLSPVVILQPDAKGGRASSRPLIKARARVANPTNIQVKLDDALGANVITVNSTSQPDIYDAASGSVTYTYTGSSLTPGRTYRLTVTATDSGTDNYSDMVDFTVYGGAIADLVPYPSPFDPAIQPITFRYILNKAATVTMNIYDRSGRLVRNIVDNDARSAGINEETWAGINYTGEGLANGVYFCEVVAKDEDGEHRRYTSLAIFGK
jgi:hypothetical protein